LKCQISLLCFSREFHHTTLLSPNSIIRTESNFSPNKAIAPYLKLSWIGIFRCSTNCNWFQFELFTLASLDVILHQKLEKCEKSKRKVIGFTNEPFLLHMRS
jgi:hypothetical protein